VLWAGYNIWNLPQAALPALFKVKFRSLSTLDSVHLDANRQPTFYRFFDYLGEEFNKYGAWDPNDGTRFVTQPEISLFDFDATEAAPFVTAWARHSGTGDRQPYILRGGNHWYVGDSPFSYITESDRYLIFADQLFDVLNEPPRYPAGSKPAFLRVEDVHPMVPLWELNDMSTMLERKGAPYAISIIPVFTDPLGVTASEDNRFVALTSKPLFVDWAANAAQHGASFVFHGFTHQYANKRNPFTAVSADDFEFWTMPENRPIPEDSVSWAQGRLEDGLELLEHAGLHPSAWMPPHYEASVLDYQLFSQLFSWNVGRVIYFPFAKGGGPLLDPSLRMDIAGAAARGLRQTALGSTYGTTPSGMLPSGQFFPYEIFGDAYGQRVVPEDIGNVQAFMNEQVFKINTVDDLIASMHRNRVLRDTWASLFVHPFCVQSMTDDGVGEFAGDTSAIERLVDAARADGYAFIDLKTWVHEQGETMRKAPQEVFLPVDQPTEETHP
jgi:uncharacterized protein YdaL